MDQYNQTLFVDNLCLPYIPQITWLLSSTNQAPMTLNDSVNTHRKDYPYSYLWTQSHASSSNHIQGKHPLW